MNEPVQADFGAIVLFGILALAFALIGYKRNFFLLPEGPLWSVSIQLGHVVIAFAIYFAVSFLITPVIGKILRETFFLKASPLSFIAFVSWLNFINSALIFLGLLLFFCCFHRLFFHILQKRKSSLWSDLTHAVSSWIIAFPAVLFFSQLFDWLISNLFHIQELPEQLAIYFLKMTFHHPLSFVLTLSAVLVFAPLIEEVLFRGCLQSLIRQHLGPKKAILLTSVLFALFHYSPEQGLSNIPIIAALFMLALFLGFLYEKQRSLYAPTFLHALFNGVSALNLYFLGGFPREPL